MTPLEVLGFAALVCFLLFLSVVESAVSQLSRLSLIVLSEKHPSSRFKLLRDIARDRRAFLLPILFANQLILVVLAVLTAVLSTEAILPGGLLSALVIMGMVVLLFRQLVPNVIVRGRAEAVLLALVPSFRWLYVFLCWLGWPVLAVIRRLSRNGRDAEEDDDEEATEEEIQAYLGVGEEEGIFESSESELIQSALEFGSTLVREIMTPRSDFFAIEEGATLAELRDLITSSKHSRIPVYRERPDHIVGIVSVRNLLALLEPGWETRPMTPIISEVLIVPETKRVNDLLKEMQDRAEQMAMIVNEYGTVSGLVTLEDLVEEIVGEIRDEDESAETDLVYESEGCYVVKGGVEVETLEETLGVEFGERDASTVSGMVVEHLGRVPAQGETTILDGVSLQVLTSDRKRIHSLRVRLAGPGDILSGADPARAESA